jgi:hypothetical protein
LRLLVNLLLMGAVALGLGFGLSWYSLSDGRQLAAVTTGPWATWPDSGAPDPDPYTRAFLARNGALPLGRSEGVAFVAARDGSGAPLDPACTYLVAGDTPQETFWTLTASDGAGRIVTARDAPLFVDSSHIARQADGAMRVRIGPTLAAGDWLETDGRSPYSLILRLYDSAVFSGLGSDISEMPSVTREVC